MYTDIYATFNAFYGYCRLYFHIYVHVSTVVLYIMPDLEPDPPDPPLPLNSGRKDLATILQL